MCALAGAGTSSVGYIFIGNSYDFEGLAFASPGGKEWDLLCVCIRGALRMPLKGFESRSVPPGFDWFVKNQPSLTVSKMTNL